jgi:ABC-type lipoprotein export system ATPase subunit
VNLTKTYAGPAGAEAKVVVFEDLNFEVQRGEKLALVGESGAGKSTLLYLLGGLDRPTGGAIYFGQNDICSLPASDLAEFRNREVGFVWQIQSLLAEFTALENVMMPLLIRGEDRETARPVALARLDEVGLQNRASHRAGELSGGEQQRVVLARALSGNPSVLLADEPTGNLDTRTSIEVMGIFQRLNIERGITVLLITHEHDIAEYGSRIISCRDGHIVSDSPVITRRNADEELHALPDEVVV